MRNRTELILEKPLGVGLGVLLVISPCLMAKAAPPKGEEPNSIPTKVQHPAQLSQIPQLDIPIKFPELKDFLRGGLGEVIKRLLKKEPPISTGLADALTEVPYLDDFNPKDLTPMVVLPRDINGDFLLRPGLYELNAWSYCLQAGKYAPTKGDGYLYAPLKGARSQIVRNILQRSVAHSEIPQRDIQALLWAILARTKINDLSPEIRQTAKKLLTSEEISQLNGGALGQIPDEILQQAIAHLPSSVQQVLTAEAQLRSLLSEEGTSYQQLEQVAVLFGAAPRGEDSREVPQGRWSYHPDGYFIRYFPSGYSLTRVEIYVPERYQTERDKLGRITRITDSEGNQIETSYDDTIPPLTISSDPAVRGYAFRSIRFVRRLSVPPEVVLELDTEWQKLGWTLVGTPSGQGRVGSSTEPFTDLEARYAGAKTHQQQLNELDRHFKPTGNAVDIADLGHYTVALAKAISRDRAPTTDWAADHINLAWQAWQYAVCLREGGCKPENPTLRGVSPTAEVVNNQPLRSVAFKNSTVSLPRASNSGGSSSNLAKYGANVAVPANTSAQRVAQSTGSSDDCQNKACEAAQDQLETAKALLYAYENEDLVELAEKGKLSFDVYEYSVIKLAAEILSLRGGSDAFKYLPSEQYHDFVNKASQSMPKRHGLTVGMETELCSSSPDLLGRIFATDKNGNKVDVESGEIWTPIDNNIYEKNTTKQPNPNAAKELFNKKYACAGKLKFSVSLAHEKIHQRQATEQRERTRQYCEESIKEKSDKHRILQAMEIEAYQASIAEAERLLQEQNCSR